jgi:TM2 domain-containing membrane protein YozV
MSDGRVQLQSLILFYSIPTVTTEANVPVPVTAEPNDVKRLSVAYLMWLPPFGLFGLHQFYLRRYSIGFLYLFTLGIFGISWFLDAVRMFWLVRDANRRVKRAAQLQKQGAFSDDDENDELSLLDAYMLWFPLGLFGEMR